MKNNYLVIGFVVGYMLKVMKSNITISKFKKEFASIRHGNYIEFINSIDEPIPEMVVYEKGQIEVNPPLKKDDIDMIKIFKAGPSLNKFYELCIIEYGNIKDDIVPDKIYYMVAVFELSLRVHGNNKNLLKQRDKLEKVINIIGENFTLSSEAIKQLHQGRRFLNMIKHFNNQFESWELGINEITKASNILKKRKLPRGKPRGIVY